MARIGNVLSLNNAVGAHCLAGGSTPPHCQQQIATLGDNGKKIDNEAQISDQEGAHQITLAELMNFDASLPKNGVE